MVPCGGFEMTERGTMVREPAAAAQAESRVWRNLISSQRINPGRPGDWWEVACGGHAAIRRGNARDAKPARNRGLVVPAHPWIASRFGRYARIAFVPSITAAIVDHYYRTKRSKRYDF